VRQGGARTAAWILCRAIQDTVFHYSARACARLDALDAPRSPYLAELALDFSRQLLKPIAAILIKSPQCAGFEKLVELPRRSFTKARFAKPDASRTRSSELYLLASGFRMV